MPVEAATKARVVVVSPHSDDGVLSVGALMARLARRGRDVTVLTVLGLDPESAREAGGWDRRAGFATEGEAARARRAEDASACAALGVGITWLPFGSGDYGRADDAVVWDALSPVVRDADVVLVTGSPLTHPDHAWLAGLVRDRLPSRVVASYAEQPYTSKEGSRPFDPVPADPRDRLAKWRALRRYRSQLPLLGMPGRLDRRLLRLVLEPERVAWPAV